MEHDELGPQILKEEFDEPLIELKQRKAPWAELISGNILMALGDKGKTALHKSEYRNATEI